MSTQGMWSAIPFIILLPLPLVNPQVKTVRSVVSLLLLGPFLMAVFVPFLWMVLGIFKTNAEFFQPLTRAFFPAHYKWQNVAELLEGKWGPFWGVFANSLMVSLGQARMKWIIP